MMSFIGYLAIALVFAVILSFIIINVVHRRTIKKTLAELTEIVEFIIPIAGSNVSTSDRISVFFDRSRIKALYPHLADDDIKELMSLLPSTDITKIFCCSMKYSMLIRVPVGCILGFVDTNGSIRYSSINPGYTTHCPPILKDVELSQHSFVLETKRIMT